MSNQTRLVLDNLTIGYRDKRVAGPLSAELRSGELTSLLGQNGWPCWVTAAQKPWCVSVARG